MHKIFCFDRFAVSTLFRFIFDFAFESIALSLVEIYFFFPFAVILNSSRLVETCFFCYSCCFWSNFCSFLLFLLNCAFKLWTRTIIFYIFPRIITHQKILSKIAKKNSFSFILMRLVLRSFNSQLRQRRHSNNNICKNFEWNHK